jgi:hypothetical protein
MRMNKDPFMDVDYCLPFFYFCISCKQTQECVINLTFSSYNYDKTVAVIDHY